MDLVANVSTHRRGIIVVAIALLLMTTMALLNTDTARADAGEHQWSMRFGDAADLQSVYGVATDSDDNILVAGSFRGAVDFGGGSLTSAGFNDMFVAKLDASGHHVWSKSFGGQGWAWGYGIAVDNADNVFVAGQIFSGGESIDFGGGPLVSAGATDIVIAKFDPDGNHLWSKRFGDASAQGAAAIATDGLGNLLLAGTMEGSVNFGGGALTSAGAGDIYVAKLDGGGGHLWSARFGDAASQSATAVAIDASNAVIVGGQIEGSVNFGGGLLTTAGGGDAFLAKFDAAGVHAWSKRYGDASSQIVYDVALDAQSNAVLAGPFEGSIDLGGGALMSAGANDLFLAKLDSSGNEVWSARYGDGDEQSPDGLTIDSANHIIMSGDFRGVVEFGGAPLRNSTPGLSDIFLAKFDGDGIHLGSEAYRGLGGSDSAKSAAVTSDGDIVVGGNFASPWGGSIDFGGSVLTSEGGGDIFVARFSGDVTDRDGDGCADEHETGTIHIAGGGRDPNNFWDYFDATGDGAIDIADAVTILQEFGLGPSAQHYDVRHDRFAPDAGAPWRTARASGSHLGLDLEDVVINLQSFGTHCP